MAEAGQPADDDARLGDDIDEVLSYASPNPDRVGCPPQELLAALARRGPNLGDPGYEHLVKCSPCYREFRELQRPAPAAAAQPAVVARPRWVALVAGVVFAVGVSAMWLTFFGPEMSIDQPSPGETQAAELRTELDLRQFAVTRSEQRTADSRPLVLPIGVVELTLLMPVGSEVGTYDIQLLDGNLQSKAAAQGIGEIHDFVTSIRTTIDLRNLSSGAYQLAVRRKDEEWRLFPARLD